MSHGNGILDPSEQAKREREVHELRERASQQNVQVLLHPAAGLVELQVKFSRFDMKPQSVFVSTVIWEALFGTLLQMRLESQGVAAVQLSPKVGG